MEYILENEYLRITVTEWGAQLKSVIRKCDGAEHIWQAEAAVWGYHAPILFPHTGKLVEGTLHARGIDFPAKQHGFARELNHRFVRQTGDSIVLELTETAETLARWPYKFRLISTFRLENDTVHHTLTVENRDADTLHCGIGYHPAFCIPFDVAHTAADYELRFSQPQSPICLCCQPHGLVTDRTYRLGENISAIAIDENLFANDSHCMVNLTAQTLGLYEKGTGRGVVCTIAGFPYTLIWSKPGTPRFVCIEPWLSLPSPENGSKVWQEKPAAWILAPGESQSVTLSTAFVR